MLSKYSSFFEVEQVSSRKFGCFMKKLQKNCKKIQKNCKFSIFLEIQGKAPDIEQCEQVINLRGDGDGGGDGGDDGDNAIGDVVLVRLGELREVWVCRGSEVIVINVKERVIKERLPVPATSLAVVWMEVFLFLLFLSFIFLIIMIFIFYLFVSIDRRSIWQLEKTIQKFLYDFSHKFLINFF